MRSLLAATLSVFATSIPLASALDAHQKPQVLEYNIETAYTKFTIPCPASTDCGRADESLVFELQVDPLTSTPTVADFILNGQKLSLDWPHYHSYELTGSLSAQDSSAARHSVEYTVESRHYYQLRATSGVQQLQFRTMSVDSDDTELAFTVVADPNSSRRLQQLFVGPGLEAGSYDFNFTAVDRSFALDAPMPTQQDDNMPRPPSDASFDLEDELDSLYLLEAEAGALMEQMNAKKRLISKHLKDHRDHATLRHLIHECDGLVCAARVVAQRICDKVGVATDSSLRHVKMQNPHAQHLIALYGEASPQQNARNCTKSKMAGAKGTAQGLNFPLRVTKNESASEYHFVDLVQTPDPLMRALEIIATVLGLAAIYSFIRRRCMSMRKRVERAADREERRNARAYRKAARRAEMRRRWESFVSAINCFRAPPEPRMEDYEEKRALILQDAFLEGLDDLDQAEKGEVMEAEIRELRHAHEIVASLVRVDEHRFDLATPVNDPPPPLVPLPFTPATRSRASTHTLPSYTSESLPDYSSRPETLRSSSTGDSIVNGFSNYTPTSVTEARYTPPSTTSSGRTRYTPTSSILDVSTRPSQETIRTGRSKNTQDL